jgi:polyhydroxyalkanoate synthesis repressor PhaR
MPLIKRYSNRKLYDVDASRYVILDDIAEMVRRGDEVKVVDYATGTDLTALTLTQVIFEQEKKLGGLLPQAILTRLLRAGNTTLQTIRGGVNALLEPIPFAEYEIRRRVKVLVDEGTLNPEQGQHLTDLFTAPRMRSVVPPVAVGEVDSTNELDTLRSQVDQLEQELEKLQPQPKK